MTHTKGNWGVREVNDLDFSHEVSVSIKDKDCVAAIYRLHKSFAEAGANAKLIAAAPDLLEALNIVTKNFPENVITDQCGEDAEKIFNAIKKATT